MSTELVAKIDAFLEACSGPGITLYEGHPAVLLKGAKDELTALTAKVALLTEALQAIIDMNVQYAKDKYGDASRAEGMACVVAARRALSEPDKDAT